jgi:hypothetical protein
MTAASGAEVYCRRLPAGLRFTLQLSATASVYEVDISRGEEGDA